MSEFNSMVGKPIIRSDGSGPPPPQDEKPAKPIPPVLARRRAEFVRENIVHVRQMVADGATEQQIFIALSTFAEGFPRLFKSLIENDARTNAYIEQTLTILDRMAESELTQHEASVAVEGIAANEYIRPVVESTPPNRR
jgi:hypothetical protein